MPEAAAYESYMRDTLLGYSIGQYPAMRPSLHHGFLAKILDEVRRGETSRLIVNMPPQFGKSKLCTELFSAYWLGHRPADPVFSFSCTQALANKFGRSVRDYVRSPLHRRLFPNSQMLDSSSAKSNFDLAAGGGYYGVGKLGTGVGRPAKLISIDDLIKNRREAQSDSQRELLTTLYSSVARPRLHPGGAIVCVGTRWGKQDFFSWLRAETSHEGWRVISIPAIAFEGDILGRAPGEHLWPERYSLEDILKIRETIGEREFQAQYQQCPVDDQDAYFQRSQFGYYSSPPLLDTMEIFQSWDLSFGSTRPTASFVVGQVWGRHRDSGYLLLLDQVREQLNFRSTLDRIRLLKSRWPKTSKIYVEKKANGVAACEVLEAEISGLHMVEFGNSSKEDRAIACEPALQRKQIWLPSGNPSWVSPLLREIDDFPMGGSDDCVDAMTQAIIVSTGADYKVSTPSRS